MIDHSYSQLRHAPRTDLVAASPIPIPFSVQIEPTNVCNLSCSCCPVSLPNYIEESGYYHKMPMELYLKILEDIARDWGKVKSLKLYKLGEPMLNRDLPEWIFRARSGSIADRIELTSNGTRSFLPLVGKGLDYLRVSVYPDSPPETMTHVIELMKVPIPDRPFIYAQYLPYDLPTDPIGGAAGIERFRRDWKGIPDEIAVENMHTAGSTFVELIPYARTTYPKEVCPSPFYMMVIRANGDVEPCCVAWRHDLTIGNVHKQSMKEIWEGEKMHQLRLDHLRRDAGKHASCSQCTWPQDPPDNVDNLTPEVYSQRYAERLK